MKIQVNSQGKAYYTSAGKVLVAPDGGSDSITATNLTGGTISNGTKVWINKNESTYNLYNFGQKTRDFTVNGNPNINDTLETASNFNTSNYINIDKTIEFSSFNTWSIEIPFRSTNFSTEQYLLGSGVLNSSNVLRGVRIAILNTSKITMGLSYDGESLSNALTGTTNLITNKDYIIKAEFDGSNYKLYLDGNLEATLTSSSKAANGNINYLGCWRDSNGIKSPFKYGLIYLSDCSINVNGQRWWTPYIKAVNENSLTGVALENISAGSSGSVKTIIPEV
jgi:hypothetical protein